DLLDSWPGTLVVASHDRYLLERVTDSVYGLFEGRLVHLPGGVDEYLARAARSAAAGEAAGDPPGARQRRGAPADPSRAQPAGRSAGQIRAARKELARLERQVDRFAQQEASLHEQLATHATDHVKLTELDAELAQVRAERA